jgi:O-acetyl-ADP-ribose deacetylase (regulator of RNase III)
MLDLIFHQTHHLQIVQGDITHEKVDAIVNAANSHLQHGGGVAAAIARAGGRTIQEESDTWVRQHGTISHSHPAHTSAGNLPSTYVIHAVGPVWGEGGEDLKMRETLRGCFLMAEELKIRSMSIPAISTGIYGFPIERAAAIFYDETMRFSKSIRKPACDCCGLCCTMPPHCKYFWMNQEKRLASEMITSLQNPKLKWVRTLLAKRNQRYLDRAFVCEGIRLAEEALHYPQAPLLALFSSSISARGMHLIDRCSCDVLEVDAALLDKVSATETSQGLLLVFPFIENPLPPNPDFLLLLDRIKDPGNFGTILRAALAFEVQGMLYTSGSVDPYSPKVVRSAMGAHFRIPLQEVDMEYLSSISHSMQLLLADVKMDHPVGKPICKNRCV